MTQENTARQRGNDTGPTGELVAKNLRRLRTVSLRDLSDDLGKLGRPITASALQKIEAGVRRVDVDDLMALAVALGVSPLTLLLPEYADNSVSSEMTGAPDGPVSFDRQWMWAVGVEPLHDPTGPGAEQERAMFRLKAVPLKPTGFTLPWTGWDAMAETKGYFDGDD